MAPKSASKKQELDVNDVLNGAMIDLSSTKKSKIPVLNVAVAVMKLVAKKQALVTKIDALKAEDEIVSADIISNITPQYEEICSSGFTSSVKLPSTDQSTITVSWKSQYSKIAPTEKAAIQSVVGENHFKRWFNIENTITVKDTSTEKLTELITLVGKENFSKFFSVEQVVVPNATFTEEKYKDLTTEQRNSLSVVVKQYKPTIRVK